MQKVMSEIVGQKMVHLVSLLLITVQHRAYHEGNEMASIERWKEITTHVHGGFCGHPLDTKTTRSKTVRMKELLL